MATAAQEPGGILIETDCLKARINLEGYVSGVQGGSFLDKRTGALDLGFGLDIVDFLLEPGDDQGDLPPDQRYQYNDKVHGKLPRRYVELPQICTQAGKLPAEIIEGPDFVAVRQWFRYTQAAKGYVPGSLWEQTLVFTDGPRYFLAADRVTSANAVEALLLRIDMPGHLKHRQGDSFEQIYLSSHGTIPSAEFLEDFPPDGKCLYLRDDAHLPERMIRAYQVRLDGAPGPWLAGMTLEPAVVYDAWCHQRGYVCFIQENGGRPIQPGEQLTAAYVTGWFDGIEEMQAVFDRHRGAADLAVTPDGWHLVPARQGGAEVDRRRG